MTTAPDGPEKPLAAVARAALDAKRAKVCTRLAKIVALPPAKTAARLLFTVSYNGYHELSVYCGLQAGAGPYVADRSPFGHLLEFDPPPGEQNNPHGFAADKPAVAELVLRQLADWWRTAGGSDYPLPTAGAAQNEPARLFDFATTEWVTDADAVRRRELTSEFALLARAWLARFRPLAAERVRKATAKLGVGDWEFGCEVHFDGDFAVMFAVTDGTKRAGGGLFPPHSQLVRLLRTDTFSADKEHYAGLGVNTQDAYHRELEQFVANVWADVAGPGRVTRARLAYHDDGAEYDLVARRWATDFLGRPLD